MRQKAVVSEGFLTVCAYSLGMRAPSLHANAGSCVAGSTVSFMKICVISNR